MTMTNGGDQTAQLTVLGTGRLPQPEGGPRAGLFLPGCSLTIYTPMGIIYAYPHRY